MDEVTTLRHNQLRSGVYLSYINLAISFVIPFVYTPIMLRLLGQAEYGLYSLSNSVIGYLTLLSFGFGTTIVRYIAKYRAEGKQQEEEECFGFFLMLYSFLAVLVMVGGLFLSANCGSIFDKGLTGAEIAKMRILTVIMAFNTALSFPLSVFASMAIAHERFLFRKVMDIISTAAAPITNLIALYLGFASVGMALAATVVQLLLAPFSIGYCFRELKLRPRFTRLPSALIREMLGFSAFTFLATLVDMLFWATDKVILGMLASTVAVAVYNVGGTFNNIVMQLSTSISGVLVPRITGMVINNTPKSEWSDLFIRVGRLQFVIIGLIVSGFSVFGRVFIDLWAGPDYADAFWVAALTMFPLCIPLIQNTGLSIVVAQNKHRFRAIVYLVIAIANVISTYLIVPCMGIIGAALCSCVSYLLGQGLVMNIYYYKVTGLDIPRFWSNILRMALIPVGMMIAGLFIMNRISLDGWMPFLAGVMVYTAVYGLLMYAFAMNNYEKDILRKPLRKILNRFRR